MPHFVNMCQRLPEDFAEGEGLFGLSIDGLTPQVLCMPYGMHLVPAPS